MGTIYHWNGKLDTPKSLRLGHDEARAEFVRATMEGGQIGVAAKLLAKICLPHFELEEQFIFPVLALLPDLERGLVRPAMAKVLPLIAEFKARHDCLDRQHQSIQSATDALLQAAHREKNREIAEFAYNLRVHERMEDEVIFPTVIMIGDYLRQSSRISRDQAPPPLRH